MSKPSKTTSKKTKAAPFANANTLVSLQDEGIFAKQGNRLGSAGTSQSESAIEHGHVRVESLMTTHIRTALDQVKGSRGKIALSIPTQNFSFYQGTVPNVKGVTPETLIENNLSNIYQLQPGETGSYSYTRSEDDLRVLYIITRNSEPRQILKAISGAAPQSKVIHLEPRLLSEARAVRHKIGPDAIMIHVEPDATYIVHLIRGEIANLQYLEDLEHALNNAGTGVGILHGIERINQGHTVNMEAAAQQLLETISAERDYAAYVGGNPDAPIIGTGMLRGNKGSKLLQELDINAQIIDDNNTPLAIEGLGLRNPRDKSAMGVNLLSAEMTAGKTHNKPNNAGYLLPGLIVLGSLGGWGYAAFTKNQQQSRLDQARQTLSELEPQVREQQRLQKENTSMMAEKERAQQIKDGQQRWSQYLELITERVPDAKAIGIISIEGQQGEQPEAIEFDGEPVNTIFKFTAEAVSAQAASDFINAFSQEPFKISIDSINRLDSNIPEAASGRIIAGKIGFISDNVNKLLDERKKRDEALNSMQNNNIPAAPEQGVGSYDSSNGGSP